MAPGRPTSLRAARAARGWSQAEAARALADLARSRGVAVASAVSLKTQLSRWENGHARPDAPYRALLRELYDDIGVDLAPADPHGASPFDPAERLRARLAAAAAVDADVIALWREQLTTARRLDDRLGTAGAGDAVRVVIEQLEAVLPHLPDPDRNRPVAVLLARSCLLAGVQALDTGDVEAAVDRFARATDAARLARSAELIAEAVVGHADALIEIGALRDALAVLAHAVDGPPQVDRGGRPPDPVARLLAAGAARAYAAAGDPEGARRALATANGAPAGTPVTSTDKGSEGGEGPVPTTVVSQTTDVAHPPAGLTVELADDLRHRRGRTLALLGDDTAIGQLTASLASGRRSARDRAEAHADLARALLAAGRGDEAAGHARAARTLATRIGSRRVLHRLDAHGLPVGSAVSSSTSTAR